MFRWEVRGGGGGGTYEKIFEANDKAAAAESLTCDTQRLTTTDLLEQREARSHV